MASQQLLGVKGRNGIKKTEPGPLVNLVAHRLIIMIADVIYLLASSLNFRSKCLRKFF